MKAKILAVIVIIMAAATSSSAQGYRPHNTNRTLEQTYRYSSSHNRQSTYSIPSKEIKRVQEFYWMRFGVRISKSEAEMIILMDRLNRILVHPPHPHRQSPRRCQSQMHHRPNPRPHKSTHYR